MNSKLATKEILLKNCNEVRKNKILKITPHHMAGVLSTQDYVAVANTRKGSANYSIDKNGVIAQHVPESGRSWCTNSPENDNQAITIEVSNSAIGEPWPISDTNFDKLVDLCVDICQRNGIEKLVWTGDKTGNLTTHDMFYATECPGPYLKAKMPELASKVNARLEQPKEEIKMESIDVVANRVIRGDYGNGEERKKRLTELGYDPAVVQKRVDEILAATKAAQAPKKSIEEIAKAVIRGDYGNGAERKNKLNAEGYRYDEVQKKVDEILAAQNATKPVTENKATKLAAAHSFNAGKYAGTYMVMPSMGNVRLVPGNMSKAAVLTQFPTKTKVQCYGYYEKVGNEIWLLIQAKGFTGFMSTSILRKI